MTILRSRFLRLAGLLMVLPLLLSTACKTSTDARVAATQLTATAKTLADYYTALSCIVDKTDQLYALQETLGGTTYDDDTRKHVLGVKAELEKRAALARTFSSIAGSFARLSGSTASTDVPASAAKLEAQVEALKVTAPLSKQQQGLMASALQLFVTAVQEHKERQAAAAMDGFTGALAQLVASEAELYDSLGSQYAVLSRSMAMVLVRQGMVDPGAQLKPALEPYGLTALPAKGALRERLAAALEEQIAAESRAIASNQKNATTALKASLEEMAKRVHRVATDNPLAPDQTPLTLETVEAWATRIVAL